MRLARVCFVGPAARVLRRAAFYPSPQIPHRQALSSSSSHSAHDDPMIALFFPFKFTLSTPGFGPARASGPGWPQPGLNLLSMGVRDRIFLNVVSLSLQVLRASHKFAAASLSLELGMSRMTQ